MTIGVEERLSADRLSGSVCRCPLSSACKYETGARMGANDRKWRAEKEREGEARRTRVNNDRRDQKERGKGSGQDRYASRTRVTAG
jgi:hypothetical protein